MPVAGAWSRLVKQGMSRSRVVRARRCITGPSAGGTSRSSPPSPPGPPVRCAQHLKPEGISEPGAGQVHHDDHMPVGGCLGQNRLELLRGGDVDLGGRRRHGQAVDHRGIPDARHLGLTSHGDAIAGK